MPGHFIIHLLEHQDAGHLSAQIASWGYECQIHGSLRDLGVPSGEGCVLINVDGDGAVTAGASDLTPDRCMLPVIYTGRRVRPALVAELVRSYAADFVELPLPRRAFDDAVARAKASLAQRRRLARLSDRERQILQLLARGFQNKGIASELGISYRTVEAHRAHLMEKTSARGLAELVSLSISSGLISTFGISVFSLSELFILRILEPVA